MSRQLLLPALRSQMGDWIYYVSRMRMQDIAERISFTEEIHKRKELNEILQRQVSNRKKHISRYLQTQKQRFFNSIIIGVYKGTPEWYVLQVGKNQNFDPDKLSENIKSGIGFLKLSGQEKLFAIDGQHRVAAIKDVIRNNKEFIDEEVPVIFVAAKMDTAGKKRTRRLFSTLNRYAKQVKRSYIIALNEDDTVAIIVRRLIEDHPFFNNKKIYIESKNLQKNDFENFTSLEALYDSLDTYLCDKKASEWEKFKTIYPGDDVIEKYFKEAKQIVDMVVSTFPALKELLRTSNNSQVIRKYRGEHGGHIIYRPIGLIIIFNAIKIAKESNMNLEDILKRISLIPSQLTEEPWSNLLWDKTRKRMYPTISKERQKIASILIFYMIDGDLSYIKMNRSKLRELYAAAIDWDEDKLGLINLPLRVNI